MQAKDSVGRQKERQEAVDQEGWAIEKKERIVKEENADRRPLEPSPA